MCEQQTCKRCNESKPITAFVKRKAERHPSRVCRDCDNEQGRLRYWARQAEMIICNGCGETKPRSMFPHNRRTCRACKNADSRRRHHERKRKADLSAWAFLYQPWRA